MEFHMYTEKKKSFLEQYDIDMNVNFNSLNIILLAHVQQPRGHINPCQLQCSQTERFSIEEFHEIYQGIVNAGFYIKSVFYNEFDFIEDYIQRPESYKNCLIYNLARNGLGYNKKTIIPSFCELMNLSYSTSSSLSCAVCRNKYYFTTLLQAHNIPTPKSWFLSEDLTLRSIPPTGTHVICKPSSESASQGITEDRIFIASPEKFDQLTGEYIIQEYIDGIECEVPVIKTRDKINVLDPIGIDLYGEKILNERNSESNHYGFFKLSDHCSKETLSAIKDHAEKAFRLLQMDVYGRVDFRIDANGTPYIFDISTTPYTTKHSSFAYAFEQMGLSYSDIYCTIIRSALIRHDLRVNQNDKN